MCVMITRRIFPFRNLYKNDLFPKGTKIVGYARSDLTVAQLKERVMPFLKVPHMHTDFLVDYQTKVTIWIACHVGLIIGKEAT